MSQQQSLVGGNGIVEIAELILQHGSTLSLQIDSSHYFEQAYNIVCSKNSNQDLKLAQYRGMAYRILALYFEEHSTEKKYYHILDRLSLLLKAARESPNHRESLLQLVDVLANSFQGDLITYWNTVMNKIVQTWLKAFNNPTAEKKGEKKGEQEQVKDLENEEIIDQEEVISGGITLTPLMLKEYKQFLFQFITILLSSRIRSLLIPHMKSLKEVCINEMFYSSSSSKIATSSNKAASSSNPSFTSLNPLIAEFPDNEMSEYVRVMIHAFGIINGLENVEYWNDTLQWISSEMIQVTKQLSLPLKLEIKDAQSNASGFRKPRDDETEGGNDGNISANKRAKLKALAWEIIFAQKERGIQKALMLKNAFIILTSLLNEIFSVGCSSGYITLDLTNFLALSSKLLVYQKNVNVSDAATFIENEQGLSQVDINFVISQFKIALLMPYRTIIQLKHPSFVRFSSSFLQPVLSLWLKKTELSVLPDLMKEVLKTLSCLVEVFPAAITHYFNDSNYDYLPNIQSLFLKHCEAISEKRTYGNVEDVTLSKPVPVTGNSSSVVPANKKQKKNDGTSNAKLSNDAGKKGKGKGKSGSSTEYTDILELMGQGKMKFYHNSEVENENDVYTILVFQLVEKILLYSFNYLSSPLFSYYINLGLHKVLTTLELGIYLHHLPDKRLLFQKNYQNSLYLPERIRLSLPLQEMVMSFTLTNILTFQQRPVQVQVNSLQAMLLGGGNHPHHQQLQKNGSGKDSMTEYLHLQQYHNNYYALNLQHYYHLCQTISSISSIGYEKIRDVATKGVLFVGHLLQPMNLPLPVVPPKETIDYYRGEIDSFVNAINDPLYRSEKQIAAERLAAEEKEVESFQELEEGMVVEVPVIEGSVAEVKVLEIVRKSESELKELAERSSLNMITVNENKKRKFEQSTLLTQTQKPPSKGNTQAEGDEDDDLPDIDISAD